MGSSNTQNAAALEQTVNSYRQNANETIRAASSGQITQQNADQYIQRQEQLVQLSQQIIASVKPQQKPDAQKALDLLVSNLNQITRQDPETIRAQWQQGAAYREAGIDANAVNNSSPEAAAARDSAVQSATSLACLREFKQTGNKASLDTARTQLEQAVAQIARVSGAASAAGAGARPQAAGAR